LFLLELPGWGSAADPKFRMLAKISPSSSATPSPTWPGRAPLGGDVVLARQGVRFWRSTTPAPSTRTTACPGHDALGLTADLRSASPPSSLAKMAEVFMVVRERCLVWYPGRVLQNMNVNEFGLVDLPLTRVFFLSLIPCQKV
jgi:hypothetical protein